MRSFWILALAFAGACVVAVEDKDGSGDSGGGDTNTTDTPPDDTDDTVGTDDGDPCTVTLPASTTVVSAGHSSASAYAVIWACAGADVSSTGAYAVIVAESGASISATGAYDLIYAKAGANVSTTGAYTEVSAESDPDVDLLGTGAVLHSCATVTVDASAVVGGC